MKSLGTSHWRTGQKVQRKHAAAWMHLPRVIIPRTQVSSLLICASLDLHARLAARANSAPVVGRHIGREASYTCSWHPCAPPGHASQYCDGCRVRHMLQVMCWRALAACR